MTYTFVREPLSKEETDRLVNACRQFREKLVIWTLLDTGLRVSELCCLRREDVQWQANRIAVLGKGGRFGKRSKRRVVPLTNRTRQLLEIHFLTNDRLGLSVGHDRLETTEIYLNLSPEQALQEFRDKVG